MGDPKKKNIFTNINKKPSGVYSIKLQYMYCIRESLSRNSVGFICMFFRRKTNRYCLFWKLMFGIELFLMMKLTLTFCIRLSYVIISMVITYNLILQVSMVFVNIDNLLPPTSLGVSSQGWVPQYSLKCWNQSKTSTLPLQFVPDQSNTSGWLPITINLNVFREGDPHFYKLLEYEKSINKISEISSTDIPNLIGRWGSKLFIYII